MPHRIVHWSIFQRWSLDVSYHISCRKDARSGSSFALSPPSFPRSRSTFFNCADSLPSALDFSCAILATFASKADMFASFSVNSSDFVLTILCKLSTSMFKLSIVWLAEASSANLCSRSLRASTPLSIVSASLLTAFAMTPAKSVSSVNVFANASASLISLLFSASSLARFSA